MTHYEYFERSSEFLRDQENSQIIVSYISYRIVFLLSGDTDEPHDGEKSKSH